MIPRYGYLYHDENPDDYGNATGYDKTVSNMKGIILSELFVADAELFAVCKPTDNNDRTIRSSSDARIV